MLVALPTKEQTVDGLEMQIGVNHFGMCQYYTTLNSKTLNAQEYY